MIATIFTLGFALKETNVIWTEKKKKRRWFMLATIFTLGFARKGTNVIWTVIKKTRQRVILATMFTRTRNMDREKEKKTMVHSGNDVNLVVYQ